MNNIKEFKSEAEIEKYINNLKIKYIGSGTEGDVSLTKDNDLVKYIMIQHRICYDDEIITTSDYNLKSFNFPNKLILCRSHIAGYRTKYFKNNVFDQECKIKEIDLFDLLEAREKMIEDIREISKEKYRMNDIENNLLFDGKRLCAIDTLDYRIVSNLTVDDNIELLDTALSRKLYRIEPRLLLSNLSFENQVKKLIKEYGNKLTIYSQDE